MRILFCSTCRKKQVIIGELTPNWEKLVQNGIYFCYECVLEQIGDTVKELTIE